MIWWLGIVVVFIGALVIMAFIVEEVLPPKWVKRLEAMERGRREQARGR